jgi:hypothetical protein
MNCVGAVMLLARAVAKFVSPLSSETSVFALHLRRRVRIGRNGRPIATSGGEAGFAIIYAGPSDAKANSVKFCKGRSWT